MNGQQRLTVPTIEFTGGGSYSRVGSASSREYDYPTFGYGNVARL